MTNTDPSDITLERNVSTSLPRQIASQIKALINQGRYRVEQRLSSVREFASHHSISAQTVVEAYSQLMAAGYIVSRRGSGYFVAERAGMSVPKSNFRIRELDPQRLGREVLSDSPARVRLGGGGSTPDWIDHVELEAALRRYSRTVLPRFDSYGSTRGYEPLRELVARTLSSKGIKVSSAGILLVTGATQGLDLIIRLLARPEDTVLIDDPGYFQTTWALKTHGVRVVGVPRTTTGPDPEAFERLCRETKAKLFFTQSALQNPTGSSMSLAVAYEILRIAERHSVTLVEDDVSGDLAPSNTPRLAMLDQLDRVLYVGSYSKTLSPGLRVGFIATNRLQLLEDLAQLKLVSTFVSCEPNEAIVHSLLAEGHYARHVRRMQRLLRERATSAIPKLERLGFSLAPDQQYVGGTFLWAQHGANADAMVLTKRAADAGILLAPGCAFRPNQEESAFFRFALPLCTEQSIAALEEVIAPFI